jgi:nucleotide-binding universal stress UspA family protein
MCRVRRGVIGAGRERASGALADPESITEEVDNQVAIAQAYLSAVAEQFAQEGVTAEYAIEDGPTGDDIVSAAARTNAELIVMCSHGRTGFKRLLRGSTADHVIKLSPIPVLLVRAREA